jgi:hypothetical protein
MTVPVACREWLEAEGFDVSGVPQDLLESSGDPPGDAAGYRLMPLPSLVVVHHSATDSGSARLFRCLHRALNGWVDVGYHFVIGNGKGSGDGEVEPGRPLSVRGAHARGSNHCSIGVCLVGNFEETTPTVKQMSALGSLLRDLTGRFGIGPGDVLLHRSVPGCSTVCPGAGLTLDAVLESAGFSVT